MTSIVLGAQQSIILSDHFDGISIDSLKRRISTSDPARPRPRKLVLFILQAPIMSLSYAIVLFLGGLFAYIVSPLAKQFAWNDDMKVNDTDTNTSYHLTNPA
jgi:hypothetical protein